MQNQVKISKSQIHAHPSSSSSVTFGPKNGGYLGSNRTMAARDWKCWLLGTNISGHLWKWRSSRFYGQVNIYGVQNVKLEYYVKFIKRLGPVQSQRFSPRQFSPGTIQSLKISFECIPGKISPKKFSPRQFSPETI